MRKPKFEMMSVLKDTTSGFQGVVLGITHYDTGCIHYGLCPQKLKKDGDTIDWHWFDESRLAQVKSAPKSTRKKPTSGPSPCAPSVGG